MEPPLILVLELNLIQNYIGEAKRNVVTLWNEHENLNRDSEPAKHLFQHPDNVFQWKVLMSAHMNNRKRKTLEALFIAMTYATLNEQKDLQKLTLFRSGVT